MVKPVKPGIKEKMSSKQKIIEKFTDILNVSYANNKCIIQGFKCKYAAWYSAFNSEKKLFESVKSQATVHLKLSQISRIITTAILSECVLETYVKYDKSYACFALFLYLTVFAMNMVSNVVITRDNPQKEYVTEVNQYFESVFAMLQEFKMRLNVLQRRCNWHVKFSSFLNTEYKYSDNQNISYIRSFQSAFHLYNIYGVLIGFATFLLCWYWKYEIFSFMEFFTMCFLFALAIAKDVKIIKLRAKLRENTKIMRNVTVDFLMWFEHHSEIYKILNEYEQKNSITDLFPLRVLKFCRKPRYLNFAISIIALEVLTDLNLSMNDFKNALMFLSSGEYFVLDKLTVKSINTQRIKQSRKENVLKKSHQMPHTNSLHHSSPEKSFDENLPLRYELRKAEPEEEEVNPNTKLYFEVKETNTESNPNSIKVSEINGDNMYNFMLCKKCFHQFIFDTSLSISKKELCQNKVNFDENDTKSLNKESEIHCNMNGLFHCKCSDTSSKSHELNTNESVSADYSEIISNTNDASSYGSNLTVKSTDNESVARELNEIHDSNMHDMIIAENKTDAEISDEKSNKTNEINDENFIKESEHLNESADSCKLDETKTDSDENETKLHPSDIVIRSSIQETLTQNPVSETNTNSFSNTLQYLENSYDICTKNLGLFPNTDKLPENAFNKKSVLYGEEGNIFTVKPIEILISCGTFSCGTFANSGVNDNVISRGINTIDETDVYANLNETSKKEFTEGKISELLEQYINETKLVNENEIKTENFVNDGMIADDPNENIRKEVVSHESCNENRIKTENFVDADMVIDDPNENTGRDFIGHETYNENRIKTETFIDDSMITGDPNGNTRKEVVSHESCNENRIKTENFVNDGMNADDPNENTAKEVISHETFNTECDINNLRNNFQLFLNENEIVADRVNDNCELNLNEQSINESESNDTSKICTNVSSDDGNHQSVELTNISFNKSPQTLNAITGDLDINKSYPGIMIGNLTKEIETSHNIRATSENTTDKNDRSDFNQRFLQDFQFSDEFESSSTCTAINKFNMNQTEKIDISLPFMPLSENFNEFPEEQKMERNSFEFTPDVNNMDLVNEFLSKMNFKYSPQNNPKNLQKLSTCNEIAPNLSNTDFTISKPDLNVDNDESVHVTDVQKECITTEIKNTEENRNDKADKEEILVRKVTCQNKNAKNKKNQKKSHKNRHFKTRNKEINNKFNKMMTSADKTENFGSEKEISQNKSSYQEAKDVTTIDLKEINQMNKIDKTIKGSSQEITEQTNDEIVSNNSEGIKNFSLQNGLLKKLTQSNNSDGRNITSEIHQNSLEEIQGLGNKHIYATDFGNDFVDVQNLNNVTGSFEMHFPLSQESCSPSTDKDLLSAMIHQENIIPVTISEEKSSATEIGKAFNKANSEIELMSNDIKPKFETPSFNKETVRNGDKCIVSASENNLKSESKNGKNDLVTLSQSDKIIPIEITDNTQSNSRLMEIPGRTILKGRRTCGKSRKNKPNSIRLDSPANSLYNSKLNTQSDNSLNVVTNVSSLNERKIQLAEESPLKAEETESEISFSEKSSYQELTESNLNIRWPASFCNEVQNKNNGSAANITEPSHSFIHKEKEMPEECSTNPKIELNQYDLKNETFETLNTDTECNSEISKMDGPTYTRKTLTRLWKEKNNKVFDIFPKQRSAMKRRIVHLERELITNGQSVQKLSVLDIKENKFLFPTGNYEGHFSSELEVTCKFLDGEFEEIKEKGFQNWMRSVSTSNLNEGSNLFKNSSLEETKSDSNFSYNESHLISDVKVKELSGVSEDPLNKDQDETSYISNQSLGDRCEGTKENLNTPLTGSSDDPNFHFHSSTSPSDRSIDASEESLESSTNEIYRKQRSSSSLSARQKSTKYLETYNDKSASSDIKISGIPYISSSESCVNADNRIKWDSKIAPIKSHKIPDSQLDISSNPSKASTSKKILDTSGNLKYSLISTKNVSEKSKKINETNQTIHHNDSIENISNDSSYNSVRDMVTSNTHMSCEDFLTLQNNYEANKNYRQETNQADLLNYHLKYKNIDLHVLDSSPVVTIRFIDERDDSSTTLTPTWQHHKDSLSSSSSSVNELALSSILSSCTKRETVEENISITEGQLEVQVEKCDSKNNSTSNEIHEPLTGEKISTEDISDKNIDRRDNDTSVTSNTSENSRKIGEKNRMDNGTLVSAQAIDSTKKTSEKNSEFSQEKNCGNYLNEQYFEENESSEKDIDTACNTDMEQCEIKEQSLVGTEATDITENEYTEDFHFEAKGIKLTCKPDSESESVEVKYRQLEDKTKLTFKTGYKKLYLKMSSNSES